MTEEELGNEVSGTKARRACLTRHDKDLEAGFYRESRNPRKLQSYQAMLLLCEHENQGIAFQQSLSMDVPILVWDRGGDIGKILIIILPK